MRASVSPTPRAYPDRWWCTHVVDPGWRRGVAEALTALRTIPRWASWEMKNGCDKPPIVREPRDIHHHRGPSSWVRVEGPTHRPSATPWEEKCPRSDARIRLVAAKRAYGTPIELGRWAVVRILHCRILRRGEGLSMAEVKLDLKQPSRMQADDHEVSARRDRHPLSGTSQMASYVVALSKAR